MCCVIYALMCVSAHALLTIRPSTRKFSSSDFKLKTHVMKHAVWFERLNGSRTLTALWKEPVMCDATPE